VKRLRTGGPCRASARGRHIARRIETGPGVSVNPARGFTLAHLLAHARATWIPQLVRAHALGWRVGALASRANESRSDKRPPGYEMSGVRLGDARTRAREDRPQGRCGTPHPVASPLAAVPDSIRSG
jgi:hypothetical protein